MSSASDVSLESLFSYYEKTQEDCLRLLASLPETITELREQNGWEVCEELPKKGPLHLHELQGVFAQLLQKHGEILQNAYDHLQQDKGYVPLVVKLLEEQVDLETRRLKKILLAHLISALQKKNVTEEERRALVEHLHTTPQSIPLLSAELQERMNPWQKSMTEYAANYSYCKLLLKCGKKSLSGDEKTIVEAVKDFQNFEHPFQNPTSRRRPNPQ